MTAVIGGRARRGRPKILFLACHLPFPPLSGGRLRELELIKRIARECSVTLMVVSKTFEEDAANRHELERYCERVEVFPAEPLPSRPLESGEPFHVQRHRCAALGEAVARALQSDRFDLVHVEGFYLMQHVPEEVDVPVLLVEQNVEYDLDRQRARRGIRDMRTQRAEVEAWRRASLLSVLTHEDHDIVLSAFPDAVVRLVPDGADHLPLRSAGEPKAPRPENPLLTFVANFGYAPNVDAASYLCGEILPRVRARVPEVKLWLVGTDPPAEVRALAGAGVRVTGRVPEIAPYIDVADVVVCPLRVGGGMKVKAIEALRRGKCIVTSSIGAQGLGGAARGIDDRGWGVGFRGRKRAAPPRWRAAGGGRGAG